MPKRALVLIDIQNDYFSGGKAPPDADAAPVQAGSGRYPRREPAGQTRPAGVIDGPHIAVAPVLPDPVERLFAGVARPRRGTNGSGAQVRPVRPTVVICKSGAPAALQDREPSPAPLGCPR